MPADAAPLYEHSCQTLGWTIDADRMSSMRKANEEKLSTLKASIKDAEENLGDIEVRDAFLAKADYLYKIGAYSPDPGPVKGTAKAQTFEPCMQAPAVQPKYACLMCAWHGAQTCVPSRPLLATETSAPDTGDRTAAKDAYTTTEQKTAGVGQKMDLAFSMLRSVACFSQALQHYSPMC